MNSTRGQQVLARTSVRSLVAGTTAEQRGLAGVLDDMHRAAYHASCTVGEAEEVWEDLVAYATSPERAHVLTDAVDTEAIGAALATIRRLGGTWSGGCLSDVSSDIVDDTLSRLDAGYIDEHDDEAYIENPAQWVTLEEMAALTGAHLPV